MILQALYDYYQRKPDLPPPGFERKEIPFVIVLTTYGELYNIEDTRETFGKKLSAKTYLVPKEQGRSGANAWMVTNLLWDHYGYVLGHPKSDSQKDIELAQKQRNTFVDSVRRIQAAYPDNSDIGAVVKFLSDEAAITNVFMHKNWPDCAKIPGCNLTFRISGNTELVCEGKDIQAYLSDAPEEYDEDSETKPEKTVIEAACLVSGQISDIARLHPRTPILGAKSNAKLVSFQKGMGFDSYGKQQNFNAPVSQYAAFAYTTALNHLLSRESKQRLQVGDASTVFWSEKANAIEGIFADFFAEQDNPDCLTKAVASLYQAPYTGSTAFDGDSTKFFVLGLSPNVARIAVRFWHVATIGDLATHIRQHFNDLEIARAPHDKPYFPIKRILNCTAPATTKQPFGDPERVPPNLGGDVMKSILSGLPYPQTLMQAVLRRVRAEQARKSSKTGKSLQHVTYERAAIIKACLNRQIRFSNPNSEQELTMALDETNSNIGYRLGRLFAALERIQQDVAGGPEKVNATIRDRYYGAASSTPLAVFPTLLRLSQHHQANLRKDKPGLFVKRDKLLGEIMNDGVNGDLGFPAILSLDNQGRFAIGYYQQRQSFFS